MTTATKLDDDNIRIVKDGEKVTVRMIFMDSVQTRIANNDDTTSVLHKPGFLPVKAAAANDAREKLYETRDAKLADAWRNPPPLLDQQQQVQKPTVPATDADAREVRYAARDRRVEQAWRT
jgi:hypothetical protein